MEGTKTRAAGSLGMFDMLKGLGMAAIIFSHTLESYPMDLEGEVWLPVFLCFIYRDMLMSAFFIISGYGFRKRPIGKCLRQQRKAALRPYLFTALATGALHLYCHYTAFRMWSSSVYETLRVLAGFALGLPHTAEYGGYTVFSCGPMWYMLALVIGWVVLDIVLNVCPERYVTPAMLAVMAAGWATCLFWELPYSLSQGLIVAFYIYIGYLAKRNKWFEKPLPRWYVPVWVLSFALIAAGALTRQFSDNLSQGEWTLGPLSILLNGVVGFGMTRWFTQLRCGESWPVRLLERVGRCSLLIFCLHTVELLGVPWYLFAAHFADKPVVGLILQFTLRSAAIAAACALLVNRGRIGRAVKRFFVPQPERRRRQAPQH